MLTIFIFFFTIYGQNLKGLTRRKPKKAIFWDRGSALESLEYANSNKTTFFLIMAEKVLCYYVIVDTFTRKERSQGF